MNLLFGSHNVTIFINKIEENNTCIFNKINTIVFCSIKENQKINDNQILQIIWTKYRCHKQLTYPIHIVVLTFYDTKMTFLDNNVPAMIRTVMHN